MIKTQKVMSPCFPAGDCNFRLSVYQSNVNGTEHLSMCLESKESDAAAAASRGASSSTISGAGAGGAGGRADAGIVNNERSCWLLFRMSAVNELESRASVHRDSYGRFAADGSGGDNTSLGWNDFMIMSDFAAAEDGYLVGPDGRATFTVGFHVIKESCEAKSHFNFSRGVGPAGTLLMEEGGIVSGGTSGGGGGGGGRKARVGGGGRNRTGGAGAGGGSKGDSSESYVGRFVWRIDNFTRLKDLLKKRKITGLCIKSRRFQVGSRDCRLIVYPRGQSQPPNHLSMFLEV